MKLVSFTVNNYRSITNANKISLSDVTVLVGKNNEGKSNLLRAINISMMALRWHQDALLMRRARSLYDWTTDYPVSLQKSKRGNKSSIFTLDFELTSDEVQEFKERYKHALNGYLPIRVSFDQNNLPTLKVVKNGKGSKELNRKSKFICNYIAQRIEFNYIPAVRTQNDALKVIRSQVARELTKLEGDKKYKDALQVLSNLQKPIIANLTASVKNTLADFLPNIKDVEIDFDNSISLERYRDVTICIDDGQNTDIQYKGDGVKSLVTLALLKNVHVNATGVSIIAIEEPEAHLHPEAINRLRDTIYSLAVNSQVIISTHNPLFVNREYVRKNILVEEGSVKQAQNIREIRDTLGVKASDNLYDAEVILLVEGETDSISLNALLSAKSKKIQEAITENRLSIMPLGGTGHLSYYLTVVNQLIGQSVVVLDSDDAASQAIAKAVGSSLVSNKDYILCRADGMKKSEFEDIIKLDIYKDEVLNEYGVDLNIGKMKNKSKIWSERVKEIFLDNGKLWDKETENDLKYIVCNGVQNNPNNAVVVPNDTIILNIIKLVESKL